MGSNFDSAIFYVYVALGKSINLSGLSLLICKVGLWGYALHVALVVKNPLANAGDVRDMGSIPGSGRSPGGGHGNPLQYSYLENPLDSGAWWATAHRVEKSQIQLK